jgi:uncharacterized protein YhaN
LRFQRLRVPAFGPFTNLDLQFPDQPGDLQVIYGANEAGKSSLLRAIRDLLFGIHGQSPDNFLHDYGDLRIQGEILNRAGARLVFQRRKGNKNTLLSAEGTQLPDSALAPFLGSVDASYFSAMFGLGARELHEGAQQLLRGEGNIGNALFSASLGGTPVQKIIEALQEEADGLFKGRSTANVSIRPTVNRHKELLRQSRDTVVNPETWDKLEKELAEVEGARKRLAEQMARLDRDLQWISRCEDALPTVGRLGEERQKYALLPPLPDLASDFVTRAQQTRQAAAGANAEVQRLAAQMSNLQTQLAACQTAPAVLAEADALDELHQDLGAYRERKKLLAELKSTLAGLEPHLRAGMRHLQIAGDFESLEGHRLSTPVRLACEEAATALTLAVSEQNSNAGRGESLRNQLTNLEAQLLSLPETDLTPLRDALAMAAEATDADRTVAAGESEVQRLTRETTEQHRQLAGVPPDLDATGQLPVPASATLRGYHERMEGLRRALQSEADAIREADKRARAIQAELARLQRQGELPSEEALRRARDHRDHGWSLVLAEWKGGGAREEFVPGTPLEEAFPQTIIRADGIADQLKIHAEAVAQAEEKRFQLSELGSQIAASQLRVVELTGALDACQTSWQAEWSACGILPRSPDEMLEWRERWNEFRDLHGRLKTADGSVQQKSRQIAQARQLLATVLGQSEDKAFSLLFAAARKRVQDGEHAAGQREAMVKQLGALKDKLTEFEQGRVRLADAVAAATARWSSQCALVCLPDGTSPEAGLTLLRERKDLLLKFDEWRVAVDKAQSTAEDISRHEQAVRGKAVALGVQGDSIEALDAALWKALAEARKAQDRHDQLSRQIEQAGSELADARMLATQADDALHALLHLAGLTTAPELEPLLAHLEQRRAVQARIDSLRFTLSGLARGQAADDFIAQVCAENPDALAERKSSATREKAELEAALHSLRETLFRLGNEKRALEHAGDAAANFRQQAESCAATLRQDASRYLRLRLATHFLQSQIERFRKENQGPLLQKSGEVFRSLTHGAFSGLGAEFNADDVPVLVGVRPDQSKVPVAGLSDGSRDQLYLALRLAALDRYLEEHEPMPLILDDLLITFDDDRTRAILPLLGALAKRTQIFLFTHHEHLLALCRETLGEGQFHLHRLGHTS